MNKAFIREAEPDESLGEQEFIDALPALPAGSRNYITPRGYARLMDEFLWLMNRERPRVTATVAWAAANGDRSENADYIYGKKRLREIDRRIRFLTRRLDMAEIVDPPHREKIWSESSLAPLSCMQIIEARRKQFPSWEPMRSIPPEGISAGFHPWPAH